MMMLLGSLTRASTKLVLSFVLVIVIMVLCFAFAPGMIRALQDFIQVMYSWIYTPPLLNDQGLILYRTLVNEATIFGILLTLLARAIIEMCAFAFGQGMKSARGRQA